MQDAKEEKKRKAASGYQYRLKGERADKLFVDILEKLVVEKRYKDPAYTAEQLAEELNSNKRYISAVVSLRTGDNYNALVNSYRLRDACRMLRSPRYDDYTAEEIGLLAGFSSRQAFYLAFSRTMKVTPRQYREERNR